MSGCSHICWSREHLSLPPFVLSLFSYLFFHPLPLAPHSSFIQFLLLSLHLPPLSYLFFLSFPPPPPLPHSTTSSSSLSLYLFFLLLFLSLPPLLSPHLNTLNVDLPVPDVVTPQCRSLHVGLQQFVVGPELRYLPLQVCDDFGICFPTLAQRLESLRGREVCLVCWCLVLGSDVMSDRD